MTINEALEINGKLPSVTDALSVGGQVTLIGLIIVFSVLIILMCVLVVMRVVLTRNDKKPAEVKAEPAAKETAAQEEDDEELIAVLTAAIAASLNTSTYNLNIKSFKRIGNNAPAWNKAGLNETINSRF